MTAVEAEEISPRHTHRSPDWGCSAGARLSHAGSLENGFFTIQPVHILIVSRTSLHPLSWFSVGGHSRSFRQICHMFRVSIEDFIMNVAF